MLTRRAHLSPKMRRATIAPQRGGEVTVATCRSCRAAGRCRSRSKSLLMIVISTTTALSLLEHLPTPVAPRMVTTGHPSLKGDVRSSSRPHRPLYRDPRPCLIRGHRRDGSPRGGGPRARSWMISPAGRSDGSCSFPPCSSFLTNYG